MDETTIDQVDTAGYDGSTAHGLWADEGDWCVVQRSRAEATSDPDMLRKNPISRTASLWRVAATVIAVAMVIGCGAGEETPRHPVSIEITLTPGTPELNEPVVVTAAILDEDGNPVDASWTVSVSAEPGSDAGSAVVDGHTITFTRQGLFSVTGAVEGSTLSDTLGPFTLDATAPVIELEEPTRGSCTESLADTVLGTVQDTWSAVETVTVDGTEVTLGPDGELAADVDYTTGSNLVETIAIDALGHQAIDRRGVLAGAFVPPDQYTLTAASVRLDSNGLAALATGGDDLVHDGNVAGRISNPVYDMEQESCMFPIGCTVFYQLTLDAGDPQTGYSTLTLVPQASGRIRATVTAHDVTAPWNSTGVVAQIGYSGAGTSTADAVEVSFSLEPSISDGQLTFGISSLDGVTSTNVVVDYDSWMYDAESYFGVSIQSMHWQAVEDAFEQAAAEVTPPFVAALFQGLAVDQQIAIGGGYDIRMDLASMLIDATSATVRLDASAVAETWQTSNTCLGKFDGSYGAVEEWPSRPLVTSLSADFITQVLHALWGSGYFDEQLDAADLALDSTALEALLGPGTPVQYVVLEALTPPIFTPTSPAGGFQLQVTELAVALYDGDPAAPGTRRASFAVGFTADVTLQATGMTLQSAELVQPTSWIDVLEPATDAAGEAAAESLLSSIVDHMAQLTSDAVTSLPLPTFDGYTTSNAQLGTGGPEGGYLTLGVDVAQP